LNLTPPRDFSSELNSLISTKKRQLKKAALEEGERRGLWEIFDQLESKVEELGRGRRARLFICFAGSEGLWREYRLPIALPSRLIVDFRPYVRPLLTLLEQFDRCCLVVADRERARIFTLYLGQFEPREEFVVSDVPGQVSEDDTGWMDECFLPAYPSPILYKTR